jgi:hypothetical protein
MREAKSDVGKPRDEVRSEDGERRAKARSPFTFVELRRPFRLGSHAAIHGSD